VKKTLSSSVRFQTLTNTFLFLCILRPIVKQEMKLTESCPRDLRSKRRLNLAPNSVAKVGESPVFHCSS